MVTLVFRCFFFYFLFYMYGISIVPVPLLHLYIDIVMLLRVNSDIPKATCVLLCRCLAIH